MLASENCLASVSMNGSIAASCIETLFKFYKSKTTRNDCLSFFNTQNHTQQYSAFDSSMAPTLTFSWKMSTTLLKILRMIRIFLYTQGL